MITDAFATFKDTTTVTSEALAVTGTAACPTAAMDLKGAGYADGSDPLFVNIYAAVIGAATIETIALQDSATDDSADWATLTTVTVASAVNLAGTRVARIKLPDGLRRYVRLVFTNTSTGTNSYNAGLSTS